MKQDFFKYLPSEILTDILLRLPLEYIATCKCVCKPWLNLIDSNYFFKSHFSKSPPTLVVSIPDTNSNWFNLFKLEEKPKRKPNPITKFDFPQATTIQGSSNGLLLLKNPFRDHLYVCNPITREFVELRGHLTRPREDCYGIGVSKISRQHKVVYLNPNYDGCHVYTLGSGSSWRRVKGVIPSFDRCYNSVAAFVSGNLHWFVSNGSETPYICCFDLEKECFSTFSPPLECLKRTIFLHGMLYTLGDCLCFCDDEPKYECDNDHVIWLLKEYEEVEKCWCKVHVYIRQPPLLRVLIKHPYYGHGLHKRLQPINVYENGDMLTLWNEEHFLYYSNKKKSLTKIGLFGKMDDDSLCINSIILTPSFLSLKRHYGMKNVISF
ncbi:F-box protein At5g65850-like [Salvia splendens]|uniref:F-box protein At5g65850-like n=1 Tax=Salvia splendens TaxID=180675 RepID=UPI001C26657D|nr:F-box protein At5g65850-like [Salvia splendens]